MIDHHPLRHDLVGLYKRQKGKYRIIYSYDDGPDEMIILLAGLQSIPSELYDAAKIDGATSFQTTRYVTLPLLFPVVFFCIAIILIGDFMLFDIPFILLGHTGGTGESALSLAMYLYRSAFLNFKLGYGAALGYVFALLVIGVSLLYVQALGKKAGLT